jgi:hypothetical protein
VRKYDHTRPVYLSSSLLTLQEHFAPRLLIVQWYYAVTKHRHPDLDRAFLLLYKQSDEIWKNASPAEGFKGKSDRQVSNSQDLSGGNATMNQTQIDNMLKWGIVFSVIWIGGLGSLIALILGAKARRIIKASSGTLLGTGRAWWCLVVGILGLAVWLPMIVIGITNQF